MPSISVVVPLFNKAETVRATLSSVLAQSFGDIEVIVIDDGSTDGGGDLVRLIRDRRLTLISQENGGVSAARNRGIMAASAEWIALLDADDNWDADHLALLWRSLGANRPVAAFTNVRLASRPDQPLLRPDIPAQIIEDYFDFALRHGGYPNMTSAMLVHRQTAIMAGLFTVGVALGEDVDLWGRLALGGPMLYTAGLTATYNDLPRPSSAMLDPARKPEFPFFAACLPTLKDMGEVPEHLEQSATRYANFLLLEYARQLLDRGLHIEARYVLRRHCDARMDPLRYGRRYARTYRLGRAAFALSGRRIKTG